MSSNNDPIVIVSGMRTPMGQFNGCYRYTPTPQLGAASIEAVIAAGTLDVNTIDTVLMGCVLPAGLGQAPARQAALMAGLPINTACTTINKMCGSGMQTVILAHDMLLTGNHQIIIAGGMENMTLAPYLLPDARFGQRLGHGQTIDHMMRDGLEDAYDAGKAMGCFADLCAKKYNISREQQDNFAVTSIERAEDAISQNRFSDEITSVKTMTRKKQVVTIEQDEGHFSADLKKIQSLPTVFSKNGTVTAANSSTIADGAAAVSLMRQSTAEQLSLTSQARIIAHHTHAQQPEWFTTAPITAIKGLLEKIKWDIDQVDLFEINEAFAVVPLVAMQSLNIDHQKLNVNGGACILGHPIGASGARILVTLINALRQRQLKRGVAALCIGGGEATAIAIEITS